MYILITLIHVIVCLFLIAVVLLQSGKSADIAAAFGGGLGSQTAFGPRSAANALTKLTTYAAVIFMLSSFWLAIIATRRVGGSGSVLSGTKSAPTQSAPAQKPGPEPQPVTPR